jgi:hypothetical protein
MMAPEPQLRSFPLEGPPPRFEAGWMPYFEAGHLQSYVAFLRPYSEGSYDLHHYATWWEATARAIEMARARPDCEYVGGPDWGQQ